MPSAPYARRMRRPAILETRWQRLGLRARSTAVAAATLGVVLVIMGATMSMVLNAMLVNSTRQAVSLRAHDIATQVAAKGITSVQAVLQASSNDQTVIQVVEANGHVLASTAAALGETAMLGGLDPAVRTFTTQRALPFIDNTNYMLAAERVTGTSSVFVITAQSLAPVQTTLQVINLGLLVALPLLLLFTGWATWHAVGRTLRSIDEIRERVDRIGAQQLHERIAVPMAEDEVARLARTMNAMLERLDASARAQRRFIADASHELRSPLTSMRTSLDVEQATAATVPPVFPVLGDELDRMTRLVHDLLLLAKADERALLLRQADVDLDDLVGGEVKRLRHQSTLAVTSSITPVRIVGDPDRLAQALRNLTDNAQRHARSRIDIALTTTANEVQVTVDDDGEGVPENERERIFERFVRLDDHRARSAGGSGLGLAIVREIVLAHGGRVRMSENVWGGAQAVLTLPLSVGSKR